MRFLITGGAGFIGSHLAERLLQRGDEVFIFDNLSTGSMENIRHLKHYDRMHYFLDTIQNRQLLAELVDESDAIFHLAAAVGVRLIVESPVRTIATNVDGIVLNECLAQTAKVCDKLALCRSMTHGEAAHERGTHNMFTGYRPSPALVDYCA